MTAAVHLEVCGLALRGGGSPRGRQLFSELSFHVQPGERWVILGPNGAGKSSLLAALAGVFAWEAGEVRVQERPLREWEPSALADRRAWCPQFWADPFAASVAQTIRLARDRGAWWGLVDVADNDDEVLRVVDRLDLRDLLSADVRTLSGGERQRVALATALLQGAPMLLLDEPSSHLDLAHQHLLLKLLHSHADAGGAVVASLHDLNLAWALASHAVLLDGQGGAFAGTAEVVMTPARLAAVFGVAVDLVEVCGQWRFWIGPPGQHDEVQP
jgi:iron complex transport system ATP-binding protein